MREADSELASCRCYAIAEEGGTLDLGERTDWWGDGCASLERHLQEKYPPEEGIKIVCYKA